MVKQMEDRKDNVVFEWIKMYLNIMETIIDGLNNSFLSILLLLPPTRFSCDGATRSHSQVPALGLTTSPSPFRFE